MVLRLRSPRATSRARSAPAAPSACAECVRRSATAIESRMRRQKKKAGGTLIVVAAKPGFDGDGDGDEGKKEPPPSSSSSSSSSSSDPGDARPDDGPALRAALALLRFYRTSLSPLMPKSCRFLPSCSEFAQISYRRFGVVRGTVLTAWRLLRCNPLNPGRTFYDPPRWPPVGLEWAFGGGGGGEGDGEGGEEGEEREE